MIARAICTRFCSPSLSVPNVRSARWSSCHSASTRSARRSSMSSYASFQRPSTENAAVSTTLSTVSSGGTRLAIAVDAKPMRGRSSKTSVRPSRSPRIVTRAGCRVQQRVGQLQQRRLARAVGSEDHPALVVADRPVQVVDDVSGVSADDDVGEFEHLRHAVSLSADGGDLRVQRGRSVPRCSPS